MIWLIFMKSMVFRIKKKNGKIMVEVAGREAPRRHLQRN